MQRKLLRNFAILQDKRLDEIFSYIYEKLHFMPLAQIMDFKRGFLRMLDPSAANDILSYFNGLEIFKLKELFKAFDAKVGILDFCIMSMKIIEISLFHSIFLLIGLKKLFEFIAMHQKEKKIEFDSKAIPTIVVIH